MSGSGGGGGDEVFGCSCTQCPDPAGLNNSTLVFLSCRHQTSFNATLAKARHCGVVQAGVVSGVAVTDVDCEVGGCAPPPVTLLSQMCPTTCEMAYPPPPLLPRPDFPHFPHLAPPPSNFPSLGPTNSFSTPSGYPGLFPRLPGIFLQPVDLLALKIFLESIITSILLLIFALSVLNAQANLVLSISGFPFGGPGFRPPPPEDENVQDDPKVCFSLMAQYTFHLQLKYYISFRRWKIILSEMR